jgi:Zn-dependent peptidase ImmA (M78 family)
MTSSPANPYLSPEREMKLCDFAEWLVEDRFPSGKRIEPVEIAQSVGIGVISGHYEDKFDGLLEHDDGNFFIYCNLDRVESLELPRARFTLAHELGHYYIDDHRNALKSGHVPKYPSRCDYESKNPVEIEADHFASCLLMPSRRFCNCARKLPSGLEGIRLLAHEFDTSLTSAAIRYAKLDLLKRCVIIKWNCDGFGWKWLSPSAYTSGLRKTIETPAELVQGSATEHIFKVVTSPTKVVSAGSTASHWFPFIRSGSNQDDILREEAISLGRFGFLTLLSFV